MPAVIQADQLDGLIKTGLRYIERERKASIAERVTEYAGVDMIFKDQKVMVTDGWGIEWNMTTDHAGTAQQVGLFDTIAPATTLHQARFNIPWRTTRVHVSWDLREVAMNRSPARILNYVKEKIFEMDVAWIEHLETQIWTGPTAGDEGSVFGIWNYWIYSPQDAGSSVAGTNWDTTGTGARVNLNLAAFPSGPGGQSRVTLDRSAPWYQKYTAVTYSDLFYKMRRGFNAISYKTPVNYAKLSDGERRFRIFCTQDDELSAADEARLQSENIGSDLACYDGRAMIRGTPITGVPKLNEIDAARATPVHPFLVVDSSQMRPICLEGFSPYGVTETGGANQPLTVTRARYLVWNQRMWNGKTSAIFTTA